MEAVGKGVKIVGGEVYAASPRHCLLVSLACRNCVYTLECIDRRGG